jgi:hypothetical protein
VHTVEAERLERDERLAVVLDGPRKEGKAADLDNAAGEPGRRVDGIERLIRGGPDGGIDRR